MNNEEVAYLSEIETQGHNRDEAETKRYIICTTLHIRDI